MGMAMAKRVMEAIFVALVVMPILQLLEAVSIQEVRQLAARKNVTCLLVFGDSSVDPGNNNVLQTSMKGNFPPYGKDFFHGRATGRFSNGRLATDFIAEALGYTSMVPAFFNPKLKISDMIHGASFASAGSGYDDLTANLSNVLPVSKQVEYFKHYKIKLRILLGARKAEEITRNAVFLLSMGTNDFLQNYFLEPLRPKQFNSEQYEDYLVSRMSRDIQALHRVGARRMAIVGVPPIGCMPLVRTINNANNCVDSYNKVAFTINSKIQQKLDTLMKTLRMKLAFADAYGAIQSAMNNPKKYGLEETSKGCCGTGLFEYGDTCKGLNTCDDRTKYVFWDAVHPTERMYKIIADEAINSVAKKLF